MDFDSVLIVDKNRPDCMMINTQKHIEESLGKPLTLPDCFDSDNPDFLDHIVGLCELITGEKEMETYTVHSDYDSDLSSDIVAEIIHSKNADPFWQRDTFVLIEGNLYSLADDSVGYSSLLEWKVGWWAEPLREKYNCEELERINNHIASGYSSEPYYELESRLCAPPIWSEKRQAFIGRFKDLNFPVTLSPYGPHYGG